MAEPRAVVAGTIHRRTRTVLTAVPVEQLHANPDQPRKHFDPDALAELAASIAQHGILQPVVVKRAASGFLIMAGERRYRAAQLAGLTRPDRAEQQHRVEIDVGVKKREAGHLSKSRAQR